MSTLKLQTQWYAVQTKSNFEKLVTRELSAKGIENYCPTLEELHQWADRKKAVQRPVFPGYIFVRFVDMDGTRQLVRQTNGAVRILGNAEKIEAVPDSEIDSIQRLLKSGHTCFSHPFLQEGMLVRVKRGALRGIEGKLVRVKNQTRLVLSVNLLCNSIAVEVDATNVEPVRASFRPVA